jgi:hypothetical protein
VIHVDGFQWDGKTLAVTSARLGDVHFGGGAVSELILDPRPLQPPLPIREGQPTPHKAVDPSKWKELLPDGRAQLR